MKKILSVLLVAILAIGCFALVGCGDATFGGNYEEATAQDVQSFANEAALAQGKDEINLADGYELYIDITMPQSLSPMNMAIDAELDMKIKSVEGSIQMAGTMKMDMSGPQISQKMNGSTYWVDGMCYESGNVTQNMAGQSASGYQKIKYDLPEFEDVFGMYAAFADGLDFEGLVEMSIINEAIGISMVRDENGTKIKFVIPENENVSGEVVLVFDADYNVTSMKYDIETRVGEDVMSLVMTYKPFNGNVSLPSDLDSYQYQYRPF